MSEASLPADLRSAGRSGALVKEIRLLARDGRARKEKGLLVAEGIHLAGEALREPGRVRRAVVSPRLMRGAEGREILERLRSSGTEVVKAEDATLAWAGDVESHQGVLLVMDRPASRDADLVPPHRPPIVLVACGVQDPGNLGSLARVVEASWGTGMVCAGHGADPFSPRALRGAAGSLFRLPVVEVSEPLGAVARLRQLGLRLVGASPRAAGSYIETPVRAPAALFVGSEGAGIGERLESAMDSLVKIPMCEGVESLNVAAAAAILLFDAARVSRLGETSRS